MRLFTFVHLEVTSLVVNKTKVSGMDIDGGPVDQVSNGDVGMVPSNFPDHPLFQETPQDDPQKPLTPGRKLLQSWLNRSFRVVISDGRIIVGTFLCTDKDANVILAMCSEYTKDGGGESRNLGLIMIPGRHIVSIEADMGSNPPPSPFMNSPRFDRDYESD